jgi:hypothetical protein
VGVCIEACDFTPHGDIMHALPLLSIKHSFGMHKEHGFKEVKKKAVQNMCCTLF